jgi:hypothetical protein
VKQAARAEAEWLTIPAPDLRIVADEVWTAVHERLADVKRAYLRGTKGQLWGRPERSAEAKYLLTGLTRCGECGADRDLERLTAAITAGGELQSLVEAMQEREGSAIPSDGSWLPSMPPAAPASSIPRP